MTATNGMAIMHHNFYEYEYLRGAIPGRANGVLLAIEAGQVTAFAIDGLTDRGVLFVGPGVQVYAGQIVGENSRPDDMPCNPTKRKQLTNHRAANKTIDVGLAVPRKMTLDQALEWIRDDELVEVTPTSIRVRKGMLDANDRKRARRLPVEAIR
jgi:GTP-binding protein